jgi:hypothetical protein
MWRPTLPTASACDWDDGLGKLKSDLGLTTKLRNALSTFFAASALLLAFNPYAYSGPAEEFNDKCKIKYAGSESHSFCVSAKGRVFDGDTGDLVGVLGKDYVYYRRPGRYNRGAYVTYNFKQANRAQQLVVYACISDSAGNCLKASERELYKAVMPNN